MFSRGSPEDQFRSFSTSVCSHLQQTAGGFLHQMCSQMLETVRMGWAGGGAHVPCSSLSGCLLHLWLKEVLLLYSHMRLVLSQKWTTIKCSARLQILVFTHSAISDRNLPACVNASERGCNNIIYSFSKSVSKCDNLVEAMHSATVYSCSHRAERNRTLSKTSKY